MGYGGNTHRKKSSTGHSVHLTHVLRSEEGFNLFMHHLLAEFSSENLLCVVEMTQFRNTMRQFVEHNTTALSDISAVAMVTISPRMSNKLRSSSGTQNTHKKNTQKNKRAPFFSTLPTKLRKGGRQKLAPLFSVFFLSRVLCPKYCFFWISK